MNVKAAVVGCLLAGFAWSACSSDEPTTANPGSGSGGSSGAGGRGSGGANGDAGRDPNKNCVKPGSKGNEKGVGAYCESSAECMAPAGVLLLCSADFGAPATAWFCTTPCMKDSECGSKAICGSSSQGMGCVPFGCGSAPDGGGPEDAEAGAVVDADAGAVRDAEAGAVSDAEAGITSDAEAGATSDADAGVLDVGVTLDTGMD